MAGMVPLPGMAAYSTAKYAVRGFSESLRMQLAPEGIGVSCLYPGATQTNLVGVPGEDGVAPEGPEGDFIRKLWAAMRVAMTPMEMGRRVVEAIKENRFHILTHREFLDEVKTRHREIEEGFPKDDELPDDRAEFERFRREMVVQLFSMPAKD
jgi:short-subunit dehydrogenase